MSKVYKVYVLNKDSEPLMPTTRFGHARYLLKTKQARVVKLRPFTIKLNYKVKNKVQNLCGGTDPGRTNLGHAVVDREGNTAYRDKVESRNKDIPKLMTERKSHRQASRRGERLTRKRLAKKHNTLSKKLKNGRLITDTSKPTNVKDIINTEARFSNRKKRRLICPTVNQLVETELNQVDNIRKILPVKKWTIEANKFAFMQMEDGSVQGVDFQNGRLKGYASVEEFVFERQSGKCYCCGQPIDDYHHIIPRSQGGSDDPENRLGVCKCCHEKIHTGKIDLDIKGFYKKYGALSILNQAIPYIYKGLVERFGEENVTIISGRDTKDIREYANLEKDHDIDAVCVASIGAGIIPKKPEIDCFEVKQYRRHDRALIKAQRERTYKLNGKVIAKNRKPRFEQQDLALSQWYEQQVEALGKKEADRLLSQLQVISSKRYYNNTNRLMPGAIVKYIPPKDKKPVIPVGTIFIMESQLSNGQYFKFKNKNIPAKDCIILQNNKGLVYK